MDKDLEAKRLSTNLSAGVIEGTRSKPVVARVPQGCAARVNVRVVPGRDFTLYPVKRRCQPRQGASRREAEPLDLPEDLFAKLKVVDKKVMAWLAQDAANAQFFLAQPVEALVKAGVDLTRSEQKTLERTHQMVREASVVPPGVRVESLSASARTRGRVSEAKARPRTRDKGDSGCGCGSQGME